MNVYLGSDEEVYDDDDEDDSDNLGEEDIAIEEDEVNEKKDDDENLYTTKEPLDQDEMNDSQQKELLKDHNLTEDILQNSDIETNMKNVTRNRSFEQKPYNLVMIIIFLFLVDMV